MTENDWKELREKYFTECVVNHDMFTSRIDMAPHDLFQWFKKHIDNNVTDSTCPHCDISPVMCKCCGEVINH